MQSAESFTILVAEDEPKIAQILSDYLKSHGYQVFCVEDGLSVAPTVQSMQPDLLLLDLMLPGKDGLDVCREVRQFSDIPIIMVTARVDEIDRVLGLELGADDYICKPFSPREVVARVKANLRRTQTRSRIDSQNPAIEVDREKHQIRVHGAVLPLTRHEYNLLAGLVQRPGRVYSRDQLMDMMYDDGRVVTDRTVDSHIKNIRRKVMDLDPELDVIQSIYGVGYKFEP
ncbi:MAG: response regulator [Acidobacteria bacterium]|nr:response regulator [Acidobacteriota bacterium]